MPTAFSIFEAAFRSFLMAAAVWTGIRLLRVRGVRAQKLAWALVLLAAGAMPFAMRSPWFSHGFLGLPPVKLPLRPAVNSTSQPVPAPQPLIPVADFHTSTPRGCPNLPLRITLNQNPRHRSFSRISIFPQRICREPLSKSNRLPSDRSANPARKPTGTGRAFKPSASLSIFQSPPS